MPTSTETALVTTASDFAHSAARELGAIAMGDELEASEYEEMERRLNGMLQSWATKANLFREATAQLTLVGGTGAATLPANVRDVMTARHIVSTTYKRALAKWNRDQFYGLPNRIAIGNPTVFYYSQQIDGDQIRVWPVPAADITLELDYSRVPFVVTAPDETLDIPQDWYEAALYGLAARSVGIFGTTKLDPTNVQRVEGLAANFYQQALDADRPDSYYMEADSAYGCC